MAASSPNFIPEVKQASRITKAGTVPATPIATSDSLHPIDLSEAQLAKLGIVLQGNGDIDFYVGVGVPHTTDSDFVSHYGFTPEGGLRIHFSTRGPLTKQDVPQLVVLPGAPRLITTTSGAKRLFSFENDDSNRIPRFHTEVLKSFVGTNGRIDVQPVFDDDSALQATVNAVTKNPLRVNRKFIVKRVKEIDSGAAGLPRSHVISKEIVRISDSLQTISRENLDTSGSFIPETLVPPDNSVTTIRTDNNIDSAFNYFNEHPLQFNDLIPIRIQNLKNPDHPNELIFWYDPTPEVKAAMPRSEATVSVPSIKHVSVSVYPNPTPARATLHFDIAGASSAHYSIRNLLGQEVMSGGTLSGSTGNIPLDLSKLDAGVYLLVTTTESGEPDVERVVVAK